MIMLQEPHKEVYTMWEIAKEYVKPVVVVIAGIFGAELLRTVGTKLIGGAVNLGQAAAAKVKTEAEAPPAPPAPPASKPHPANVSEVNK
jgi:hypothetical protein